MIKVETKGLNTIIKQLEQYKSMLDGKINTLIKAMVDRGVRIARYHVESLGIVSTGELSESIVGLFDETSGIGIIRADTVYAVYVEFGTGIVGQGSPHPIPPEGWVYDVNAHGEKGWWYYSNRDDRWHWTKGVRSRPFMYYTVLDLEREFDSIVKEVIGID